MSFLAQKKRKSCGRRFKQARMTNENLNKAKAAAKVRKENLISHPLSASDLLEATSSKAQKRAEEKDQLMLSTLQKQATGTTIINQITNKNSSKSEAESQSKPNISSSSNSSNSGGLLQTLGTIAGTLFVSKVISLAKAFFGKK